MLKSLCLSLRYRLLHFLLPLYCYFIHDVSFSFSYFILRIASIFLQFLLFFSFDFDSTQVRQLSFAGPLARSHFHVFRISIFLVISVFRFRHCSSCSSDLSLSSSSTPLFFLLYYHLWIGQQSLWCSQKQRHTHAFSRIFGSQYSKHLHPFGRFVILFSSLTNSSWKYAQLLSINSAFSSHIFRLSAVSWNPSLLKNIHQLFARYLRCVFRCCMQ